MTKIVKMAFGIMLAFTSPIYAADSCNNDGAIWAKNVDEGRIVVYHSQPESQTTPVRFELWNKTSMLWRINAEIACSNGVSFCGISVPLNNGKFVNAGHMSIVENGNHAKYLIFDHLAQSAYRAQAYSSNPVQLKIEPTSAFNKTGGPIALPSIYKFFACKKKPKLGAMTRISNGRSEQSKTYVRKKKRVMLAKKIEKPSIPKVRISDGAAYLPDRFSYLMPELRNAIELVARRHEGCESISYASLSDNYSSKNTAAYFVTCKVSGETWPYQNVFVKNGRIIATTP